MNLKKISILIAVILFLVVHPRPAPADTWNYTISASDTLTTIDTGNTTAVVDTTNHVIKLPFMTPNSIAFAPDGSMDYVVMAPGKIVHYSFDQVSGKMVENNILDVPLPSNPIAVAAPAPYPDIIAITPNKMYHYSFTGSSMVENPSLEAAGLAGVAAIGANSSNEVAGIVSGQVKAYQFDQGSNRMVEMPSLEPSGLTNPISIALNPDNYDMAVLDSGEVKYFNFSGDEMVNNPDLAVTGLTNPKVVSFAGGYDIAVLDGSQVKQFSFNGSSMSYNVALSVTSGLTSPSCVAVRPGSYDRIIADGDKVKYYQWDGSALVYNDDLSVTAAGLSGLGSYAPSGVIMSQAFTTAVSQDYLRVLASVNTPDNTSVTWYLTADGTNWTAAWRARGTSAGSVCESTTDNGVTWNSIGDNSAALPSSNNIALWTKVNAGTVLKWKAVMATSDLGVTPEIITSPPGGIAVELDSDSPPLAPVLPTYSTCFTTTTPQLSWTYIDLDVGDTQYAYEVQVYKASDITGGNPNAGATPVIDSGELVSSDGHYTIPSSNTAGQPGPLWLSGTYQFAYRVMTWDQAGLPSPWSACADFCVIAFERPRIGKIFAPPLDQQAPVPADPSTYIMVMQNATADQLPKVKAGAMAELVVDSIGPLDNVTAVFPYTGPQGNETATVQIPLTQPDELTPNPVNSEGSQVNRWTIGFYTDPSLTVCPTGTVVQMQLTGSGPVATAILNAPPWAEGVIVTEGSIYDDWFVVLQGSDNPQ